MASKKPRDPDGKEIAKAISDSLPGWKLASNPTDADVESSTKPEKADRGASLKDLRKKFLGKTSDSDSDADADSESAEDYGSLKKSRRTVRVEPTEGGPSKVADIDDDEARIVQG